VFYDFAQAVSNRLDGEDKHRESISSIGAGLRWNIQRNFNLRFDLARVMDGGGSKETGDLRGHISVYVGF